MFTYAGRLRDHSSCQWSCIVINAVFALLLEGATPDLSVLFVAAHADGIPSDALDAVAGGDTNVALIGAAPGAGYGASAIPRRWLAASHSGSRLSVWLMAYRL